VRWPDSPCFGAYERDAQVSLTRVVTDSSTFAWLADVFVVETHRGRGLGAQLIEAVLGHPDLRALKRVALVTSTAPALYARYGFTALVRPDIRMERLAAVQLPPA
jgi:predicted N-acetyltransferase YhbS